MPRVQLASGKIFDAPHGVSLLDAAAKSGTSLYYSCKTGRCSTCKCKVVSGETTILFPELSLTDADKADGWVLSCARAAASDLVLHADDLGNRLLPSIRTLPCRIDSLEKLTLDILKVTLRLPPSANFDFMPGQYIEVIGPDGVRRSYSIANSPRTDQKLELHIKAVKRGIMSRYWFNRAGTDDLLRLNGPLGTFFVRDISQRHLIFLATGTGMAPVKAMLESLTSLSPDQMPQSVTVFWGGRYIQDLYLDVLDMPGAQSYIPVLTREPLWRGERGYIQDVLLRHKFDLRNCSVYACGSDAMIYSAKTSLTAAGLLSQHFYSDAFVPSGAHFAQ